MFCRKCGKEFSFTSKRMLMTIIISILMVLTLSACETFSSADELCAEGKYQEAYKNAKTEEEKKQVEFENLVAYYTEECSEKLKSPSSFVLKDAYYYESEYESEGETRLSPYLIIYGAGENDYGGEASGYFIFWQKGENYDFGYVTAVSDLSESSYEYDGKQGIDEISHGIVQNEIDNTAREKVKEAMSIGKRLQSATIQNMNKMFKEGKLQGMSLIPDVEARLNHKITK